MNLFPSYYPWYHLRATFKNGSYPRYLDLIDLPGVSHLTVHILSMTAPRTTIPTNNIVLTH